MPKLFDNFLQLFDRKTSRRRASSNDFRISLSLLSSNSDSVSEEAQSSMGIDDKEIIEASLKFLESKMLEGCFLEVGDITAKFGIRRKSIQKWEDVISTSRKKPSI